MRKFKGIAIDSDPLIFEVTEGSYIKDNQFENEQVKLKPYKERFRKLILDIQEEVFADCLGKYKIGNKVKVLLSDADTNFRYDIFPAYKANRKASTRSELFYRLRKWVLKEYGYVKNVEADDRCKHYIDKGYIICAMDKDIIKGLSGVHFDTYHTRRFTSETSITDATNFNYLQTLMGDSTDGIVGIRGVGEKTARKLLDEYGWSWGGVIKAYESKGLTKQDAQLNARLVLLTQWSPKKGIRLIKL